MTEKPEPFGDPLAQPFWAAAAERRLVVQRCDDCGAHQFYPRPYCLSCQSDAVSWVGVKGTGTVYSMSTVHMAPGPEFKPPYDIAVVELAEGPRLVTRISGGPCGIGDPVRVVWQDRDGAPPLPLFAPEAKR